MSQDVDEVLETKSEESGSSESSPQNSTDNSSGSGSGGNWTSTFLKILRGVADLIIVVAVVIFVDSVIGYTSSDDASAAAGFITFSFVVKEWINQYLSKGSKNTESAGSDKKSISGSAVMLAVGAILISSISFEAMDVAGDAVDEANDAMEKVEELEYRVEDLEY